MTEERGFTITASKEGIFLVYEGSEEKIRLTKKQFKRLLEDSTFTESRFTVNPGHYGEWLSMQIKSYLAERKAGKSPYDERVVLKPVKVSETVKGEAADVYGVWQCFTESGKYIHDAALDIEDLTGPIVKAAIKAGLSVAEVLKTIIQLNMSGASATEEDEKPLETVFAVMEESKRGE